MRGAILIALVALSACNQPADFDRDQPEAQTFELVDRNGSVPVAGPKVVRDKATGCEYLVFRAKFGISVVPRMERRGPAERIQICKESK